MSLSFVSMEGGGVNIKTKSKLQCYSVTVFTNHIASDHPIDMRHRRGARGGNLSRTFFPDTFVAGAAACRYSLTPPSPTLLSRRHVAGGATQRFPHIALFPRLFVAAGSYLLGEEEGEAML